MCACVGSQSKQRCAKTIKWEGEKCARQKNGGMGGGARRCSGLMGMNDAGRQSVHADLQGTEHHYQTATAEIRSTQMPDRELIKTSRRHHSVSAHTRTHTPCTRYSHVLINARGRRKVITFVCIWGSDY